MKRKILLMEMIIFALAVLAVLARADWSTPVNVSKTPDDSGPLQMIVDTEDNVYLVWEEGFGANDELFYSYKEAEPTNPYIQWSKPVAEK